MEIESQATSKAASARMEEVPQTSAARRPGNTEEMDPRGSARQETVTRL
jgi:hypothetical protein